MENNENVTSQTNMRQAKPPKQIKFMTVGGALKVTCVGLMLGVLLRVIQMLYCFDFDTGFYTDGGVMAWCSLIVTAAAAIFGGVMCHFSRRYFGPYLPRKNNMMGVVAVLSGLVLMLSAVLQAVELFDHTKSGMAVHDAAGRDGIHAAFMVTCFLFGVVQIISSVSFFKGRGVLEKAPLLYLTGVAWGIAYLIMVYVFYARSSSFIENFFAVISGVCMLLCLFYMCKLFAWVDEEAAAKRVFICGIPAVILTITYSFSNLALMLLGKSYSGEIPAMIQLSSLGVALFILMFLMTFKKYSIRRTPRGSTTEFIRLNAEQQAAGNEEKSQNRTGGRRFRPD